MSEHGWPDFHDDGGHHHDDGGDQHEDLPQHDDVIPPHDDTSFDDVHHDGELPEPHDTPHDTHGVEIAHETPAWQEHHDIVDPAEPQEVHPVGADPDALSEPDAAEAVTMFPPVLDVGPLPEPVDGFPWIDTGSLGLVDPSVIHAAAHARILPQDLADYAGAELPPGQDPWAALSDSDDPATSALAKWWADQPPV